VAEIDKQFAPTLIGGFAPTHVAVEHRWPVAEVEDAPAYLSAEPGEVLPRLFRTQYRLIHVIGRGSFGKVYFARDVGSGAPLAIKVLAEDIDALVLDQVRKRFAMEAAVGAFVSHPGVVRVVAASAKLTDREPFMAMEFLEGARTFCKHLETVAERSQRSRAPVRRELARIGHQLASAMHVVHAAGVVHRDLKPENVLVVTDPFLDDTYRVKVVDFGIAKIPLEKLRALGLPAFATSDHATMGTEGYMAPEQDGNARDVTDRADVYSLGVMLRDELTKVGDYEPGSPKDDWTRLVSEMTCSSAARRPSMEEVASRLQLIAREEEKVDIGRAVYHWLASGKQDLPRDRELLDILAWSRGRGDLTPEEREFLSAAAQRTISGLRRLLGGLAAVVALAVLAAGAAAWGLRVKHALNESQTANAALQRQNADLSKDSDQKDRDLEKAARDMEAQAALTGNAQDRIGALQRVVGAKDKVIGGLRFQLEQTKRSDAEALDRAVASARAEEQQRAATAVTLARGEEQRKAVDAVTAARMDEQQRAAAALVAARAEEQQKAAAARIDEQRKATAALAAARAEERQKTLGAVAAARKDEQDQCAQRSVPNARDQGASAAPSSGQ
jgi:serine/threonine protein kinase